MSPSPSQPARQRFCARRVKRGTTKEKNNIVSAGRSRKNTAPPRCFCRQKRNRFEAGKRESGKAGKRGQKRKEKTGEERENESGQDRQGDDGGKRQSTRTTAGRNGRKEGGARRRGRSGNLRGAPFGAPVGHDLTRHPPGRTLRGAKNKKTPPQRGGVKNYLLLVNTGAVLRRGKHGASRNPAISHSRAPAGDQSALGRDTLCARRNPVALAVV